jgi:RecA/RadA recombinase
MPRMPVTELNKKIASLETKLNRNPEVKGASVMTDIADAPNAYFLRRPSGIIPLDLHTGGGLPAGGLTYISGVDGAGKTFLVYKYIAMNQKLYGERASSILAVSENPPDHFFMRRCGVKIRIPEPMIEERIKERKERGLPGFTKEQLTDFREKTVGTVKLLRGAHGEELLGGVLECFDSGLFDIIALDSISACLPEADAGKDLDEAAKRAAAALMVTRFFQHYLNGTTGYSGENRTTTIFTSQVRSNSKKTEALPHMQKYIPDYAPQGAWAAKHGKLIDILLKPGEKEKVEVNGAPAEQLFSIGDLAEQRKRRVQTGKTVKYEILKGKAGIHEGIAGEFDFHFDTLTNDQRMLIVTGIQQGFIYEKDGLITIRDPVTQQPFEGMVNIAGIEKLEGLMRADFDFELGLRRTVLTMAGIECAYR